MPNLRNYHLLISHSWDYNSHYEKIETWLNESVYFKWSNYSVCCNSPLNTKSDSELKELLSNRINNCSAIIVLAGMYTNYSKWIDFEIDQAIKMGKPIIGVRPWGAERVPIKIQLNATIMVNWQANSIITAIRENAL